MLKVPAPKFRAHLFDSLDQVTEGETIIVERNHQEVAQVTPTQRPNWRERMTITPKLLVPADEFIKPLPDVWNDYL